MFKCNLLKLSFVPNFIIKLSAEFYQTCFTSETYDCSIIAREMLNYLCQINCSVNIKLISFGTKHISNHIIYKYPAYYVNIK